MKIAFDYKIFYQQGYGGISNYFINLFDNLNKFNKDNSIISPIHKNCYLKLSNNNRIHGKFFKYLPSKLNSITENLNHFITSKYIRHNQINILHETYYSEKDYNKSPRLKKFCTVFDLISEKFPSYFNKPKQISFIKKKTIERCDHIFCISNTTKKDLMEIFNVPEDKISITLLASPIKKNYQQNNFNKKFDDCLLFVGSRKGYKNFRKFIEAFSLSRYLTKNFRIIAFGGENIEKEEMNYIKKYKMEKKIHFYNEKNYSLEFLYRNVRAFVNPSLYEGFGITTLEAMSSGCPVLSSSGGSLKEIGADCCTYFDPNDLNSISNKIEELLCSDELIKKNIQKGFKRVDLFSWENCAKKTFEAYKLYSN